MTAKSIAVMVGAGASMDCANAASIVNDEWKPPLAKELFDISSRQVFDNVLSRFRGASALACELAELSRLPNLSLEQRLRDYHSHSDPRIRSHYLDVPRYLGALL